MAKKELSPQSEAYLKAKKEKERKFKADRKKAARLRQFGPVNPYKDR